MNRLHEIFAESPLPDQFAHGYLSYLTEVLARLDRAEIAAFANALLDARNRRAGIFFLGNGGSAATASHFANDIAIGCSTVDKPFRALSLADNVAVMTALANDYSYEEIFVRQLQTLMAPGDVVVAISVSGNSANVLRAIDYANAHGAITIGLTGFDGGELGRRAKLEVRVPTSVGEYGPAEDAHMILDHLVSAFLTQACRTGA